MDFNDHITVYNYLIDRKYFTEAELKLVCYLNGANMVTLNDAIYARYGCHDIEQLIGE